jgi:hypothetical protein
LNEEHIKKLKDLPPFKSTAVGGGNFSLDSQIFSEAKINAEVNYYYYYN